MAESLDDSINGGTLEGELLNDPLTPRQRFFVEEYLKDFNATQAAIRAGYPATTAGSLANEYLAKPRIALEIARAKAVRVARCHYEADVVLAEMSTIAHSDVSFYRVDLEGNVALAEGAPPDALKAIKKIKRKTRVTKDGGVEHDVEIELWDKPNALKLMGRHVGLFPDKVELTGKDGEALAGFSLEQLANRAAELALEAQAMSEKKQ